MLSSDYMKFRESLKREPRTWYEKLCKLFEALGIEPDEKQAEEIRRMANEAGMAITPKGAVSFAVGIFLLVLITTILLAMLRLFTPIGLRLGEAISILILDAIILYYLLDFPKSLYTRYRLKMKAGFIQAFMYMAIYLRENPSMEGALRYAAENTKPPISNWLRSLLWSLETGEFTNLDEALSVYLEPWKDEREITQTFQLFGTAVNQPADRRDALIKEAISLLMRSYRERSMTFNQSMRMPFMALNAFGMFMPVIGMVLLPVAFIFIPGLSMGAVFIIYDIILPILLLLVMEVILRNKPVTFEAPQLKPRSKIWLIAGVAGFLATVVAYFLVSRFSEVLGSYLFVAGLSLSIAASLLLYVGNLGKIRDDIKRVEEELPVALFSLANELSTGYSFEVAIQKALKNMRKLKLAEFFRAALANLQNGMGVKEAFFGKVGAVQKFPGDMLRSVMRTVISSLGKGTRSVSNMLSSISAYLKEIKDSERAITEILGEVTASIKFQALFLNPILIGALASLTKLTLSIIRKINSISLELRKYQSIPMGMDFGFSNISLTEGAFIIVTGVYLVESVILLTYFSTVVEEGFDWVEMARRTKTSLAISLIVYTITLLVMQIMFGGAFALQI